jgi:hypothetical protein
VLGPILFVVYTNDIDLGINGSFLKSADDTKLFNCVGTADDDIACFRNNLHKFCHWSDEWWMLFNVEKCKVMLFGRNNPRSFYHINK